jgi:hypothetical protein
MSADPAEFKQNYNQKPFQFKHSLANSPLFTPSRIAAVAERMLQSGDLKKFLARSAKTSLSDAKFKDMPLQAQLSETITHLEESKVWLKLSSAHTADPEYDELHRQILRELEDWTGQPLRDLITWSALTVFMASPRITTPYHIDHESNFLFQVSGSKDVSLHNPRESEFVPDDQLERFFTGDFESVQYRPELQNRGTNFRLDPGTVVHHPPLAPHWVQNLDKVSVSVSIGFCMKTLDPVARVYQVNHLLRRLGLHPTAPGRSKLRDQLKFAALGMISKSHPTTPDEILFSGYNRLLEPPRAGKRWLRSLRH